MKRIPIMHLGAAALSVAFVVLTAAWLYSTSEPHPVRIPNAATSPAPTKPNAEKKSQRSHEVILRELGRADGESRHALDVRIRQLDGLFDQANQGVPRFVEHVLGLESQLALISDWLPWSSGNNHARTLRRAFHTHALDPDYLDQLVRRIIKETLEDIQDIDDALLVRLRVDLENAPPARPDLVAERDSLIAATGLSLSDAIARSRPEVTRAIAAEVATLVTSEFVTWSVLHGAAASGLLAAGSASAPISFGVGLAAFLAVDQAMCWAIDRWADPHGTLIRRTRTKLVELRRLVLECSPKAPGLRPRLEQMLRERSAARRTRIFQTLGPIPTEAN